MTPRELNRATMARQWLLSREDASPLDAIAHLAGMQAQEARPPFIGLWSRLHHFRREDLTSLLIERKVVRATAMRATLHLMAAGDFLALRATLQPMLTEAMRSVLRGRCENLDVAGAVETARRFFAGGDFDFDDLRKELLANEPACDERALAYAVRMHLPLVQVADGSAWGFPSSARFAPAESWLGRPIEECERKEELVHRYLAAFGPASATDAQAWSGLKGLAAVFKSMRDDLVVFKDERGREIFDLPDSPRPSPDTMAPARFLPDYDNLLLAYSDRTRIISDEHRKRVVTANLRVLATFTVDGFVAGAWKIERKKAKASLILQPFAPIGLGARDDLAAEGKHLLNFIEPDAPVHEIDFRERD